MAPASNAQDTEESSARQLSMTTRAPGQLRAISRVAAPPSMPGMVTSITITSGEVDLAISTAAAPSAALPQSSKSGWAARTASKPNLISSWSSTMSTRITAVPRSVDDEQWIAALDELSRPPLGDCLSRYSQDDGPCHEDSLENGAAANSRPQFQ